MNQHVCDLYVFTLLPGVEPLPFFSKDRMEEDQTIPSLGRYMRFHSVGATPSVPLMTLPICMQFARNIGGRSFVGRRLTVNMFSRAMSNMNMDRVQVPMNTIDRNRLSLSRVQLNKAAMNNAASMAMLM